MTVSKNDVNQIFAENAPDEDKPPKFDNYTQGWGASRSNNGKPTIKGFNFLQQRTDQNFLWIHQNGGALPYDSAIEYVDGAIVLKDGKLQQLKGDTWSTLSDDMIQAWSGITQQAENKLFTTSCFDISALRNISVTQDRLCQVTKDTQQGIFKYEASWGGTDDNATIVDSVHGGKWVRKIPNSVQASWFEPSANGTDLDDDFINRFRLNCGGLPLDLQGKTYKLTNYPNDLITLNGYIINVNGSGAINNLQLAKYMPVENGNKGVISGRNNFGNFPVSRYPNYAKAIVCLGSNNAQTTDRAYNSIIIGESNFKNAPIIGHSTIAIGSDIAWNLSAKTEWYDQSRLDGSRNVLIGNNVTTFLTTGNRNVVMGRNAGQCIVGGGANTVLGHNANAGDAPIGLSGIMENCAPNYAWGMTVIGSEAGRNYIGTGGITAIGQSAGAGARKGLEWTAIGSFSASTADNFINGFGKVTLWSGSENGTYQHTDNTLVLTVATHGAVVGGLIGFRLTSGDSKTFGNDPSYATVTAVTDTTITVNHPTSRNANGSCILLSVCSTDDATSNATAFVTVGAYSARNCPNLSKAIVIGHQAGQDSGDLTNSTIIGSEAGRYAKFFNTVGLGRQALYSPNKDAYFNGCTALGNNTMKTFIDGSAISTLRNSTAIGYLASVSGDNQLQLGQSGVTTYAYGAVQDRSDKRDKADIQDIDDRMIDVLLSLKVKQYHFDYREDYKANYIAKLKEQGLSDDQISEKLNEQWSNPTELKDGSKKGKRLHNGLIAQEVEKAFNDAGLDFAGLQHHEQAGGTDTYTLGYQELTPLLIRNAQRQQAKIDSLEERLAKLEELLK